ncbi:hypothetical protein SAMN05880501_11344 [Ureibacillus xyleni]|uniref:Uncharacterized protein n=1 Tax=Ureibacillus xyleni TaxID=614648 RepID=A0A285TME9_9BACL|nr:hypothetical protein [Ureibacillus xyleni]SOC21687.1 hypothetical protein SAMN05880501_11344 [Ureibacillus xyleni]
MRTENPNPTPFSKGDPQLTGLAQKVGAVEKGEADVLNSLFGAVPTAEPEKEKAYMKRGSLKADDNDYQFIKKLSSLRGVKQYELINDMVKMYASTLTETERAVLKDFISK